MTEENQKNLERDVAEAMVSAMLASSPRLDTFSTWLMGITTGFLVLLFTNIERTISFFSVIPVKTLIVVLTISTVIGLFQKYQALRLQLRSNLIKARNRKMLEVVRVHSGQTMADPFRYFREKADVVYMLALFASAFPNWTRNRIHKMIVSVPESDLSKLQEHTKRLFWQFAAIALQLIGALSTVVILLFSL